MSITIGTQTISTNPSQESRVDYRKQSQVTREFEDGSFETFTSGRTMIDVTLLLDFVKETEADNFLSWLRNTVNFSRHQFTVTPPSSFDIGAGKGVAVTNCTYVGPPDTKSVYKPVGRLGAKRITFTFSYPQPIDAVNVDALGVVSV